VARFEFAISKRDRPFRARCLHLWWGRILETTSWPEWHRATWRSSWIRSGDTSHNWRGAGARLRCRGSLLQCAAIAQAESRNRVKSGQAARGLA